MEESRTERIRRLANHIAGLSWHGHVELSEGDLAWLVEATLDAIEADDARHPSRP
jgi:hypothetical protein